jgi:hypothetical protein
MCCLFYEHRPPASSKKSRLVAESVSPLRARRFVYDIHSTGTGGVGREPDVYDFRPSDKRTAMPFPSERFNSRGSSTPRHSNLDLPKQLFDYQV